MSADKKDNCPNGAEIAVPWAGKIYRTCKEHANGLVILSNAMGSPIEARSLPPNSDGCDMMNDLEGPEGETG